MIRPFRVALLALLVLPACASGVVEPRNVTLLSDRVLVRMDDNSLCRGLAPAPGSDWRGMLEDCPHPYAYSVAPDPDPSLIRQALEKVAQAFNGESLLQPVGTVLIIDSVGTRHVFAAPPPRE